MNTARDKTLVLVGAESSGKSSIFRGLTGFSTGEETNYRGSTVTCRRCHLPDCDCMVVDTPGIRDGDTAAARLALAEAHSADRVLLVVRGTDLSDELDALLRELPLHGKRTALAVTFEDKAPDEVRALVDRYRETLGVPVVMLNARDLLPERRVELIAAIREARPGKRQPALPKAPAVCPAATVFEHRLFGPILSLAAIFLMYGLPVWIAYACSDQLQPHADAWLIAPLKTAAGAWPAWLQALATGDYGLLTLGLYSFLWAFPVVLLIGASTALAEESGLRDRVSRALDPWLRKIGLDGRDLLPVLTGYGCNVVAVLQSRSCASCTRKSCVSLIAFGSACSYQIGATLAVFSAAGRPGLFFPYILALFVAGAIHTRLWHGRRPPAPLPRHMERAFLQKPAWRAAGWRVRAVVKQFLMQAMPVFLGICLLAAALEITGALSRLARLSEPVLAIFSIPGEAAGGIVLSVIRKDGILLLANDDATLIAGMGISALLVLVWLASTLSACSVTLWTIGRELGWKSAARTAGQQALTSISIALLIAAASFLIIQS